MFTMTLTLEQHIEELRAELRGTIDAQEAVEIREELAAVMAGACDSAREVEA